MSMKVATRSGLPTGTDHGMALTLLSVSCLSKRIVGRAASMHHQQVNKEFMAISNPTHML
jgi:hypothetical protein